MEPEPESFPEDLADTLAGLQRLIRRRLRGGTNGPRLRGAEVDLLRLVAERPGLGVSEAAKELYLAPNSVSTLVNSLVRDGFLVRETDAADRRAVHLLTTPAADARLRDWRQRRAVLVRRQVDRLDDADRAALEAALPALRELAANLHEEAEES